MIPPADDGAEREAAFYRRRARGDNEIRMPGHLPDYIAEADRNHPAVGEHGVRFVHVFMLREVAGHTAIERARTTDPSTRAILLTRERLFDEIANILEPFVPPMPKDRR